MAQIRDSGFASITEQNLNILWSGFFRVVTTQNKNVFFVVRNFSGCDGSEQKRFLCPGTRTGRFVVRNVLGLWPFRAKTGCFVLRDFLVEGAFCGQEYFATDCSVARNFCELVTFVSGSLRPNHVRSKINFLYFPGDTNDPSGRSLPVCIGASRETL